jgi:hypothetical protein
MGRHAIDDAIDLLERHDGGDRQRKDKLVAMLRAVREGRCGSGLGCIGCSVQCDNALILERRAPGAGAALAA